MIKILNYNKYIIENKLLGPITSPQIFTGGRIYHPDGLFSEEIFGIEGSLERKKTLSWIELNCKIIHPMIYDILSKRIERKITKLLSQESKFSIDEKGHLIEDVENGTIDGFMSLINNIDKIRFRKEETGDQSTRDKLIDSIEKNILSNEFFIDKLIIISPDYRPIIFEDERPIIDEMNEIYRRIIELSNQIKDISGVLYDILSYKMQLLINDLLNYIRTKVSKKEGMIRSLMLGKRVDFSARAVISPDPSLNIGEISVPLRIICGIFEPKLLYGLLNAPQSENIPEEFHSEVKKFLGMLSGEEGEIE